MYQMLLICQIYLFRYCEEFNCDLSNCAVSNVNNMYSVFYCCEKFNCDLSNWDVYNVNNMEDIFYNCNMKIIPNWYWYKK